MGKVISLVRTVDIKCPLCLNVQRMRQSTDKIWFPVSPFCCDAMRYCDSPEWNKLLDLALEKVL